jgi:hypothetical protein
VDQAAALEFLATHLGVDQDDFEYEWGDDPGHTFYQHSTDKRHTVHDPTDGEDDPVVTSAS